MDCKDCLFLFDEYLDDELEARENSEISEHLAICQSCANFYKEFRRQQEIVERYLLRAEASPALWKNLQTAIKNENVIPSPRKATTGGKFKSAFNNLSLIFSPRAVATSALVVITVCTFVFFLVGERNRPAEHAQNNRETPTVSGSNAPICSESQVSGKTEKENSQTEWEVPMLATIAKPPETARNSRSVRRITLPRRRTERKKTETVLQRPEPGEDLLPGEEKYLETIARLTKEVKSVEADLPPVLSAEYKRNLSAVNQAIVETRKSAQRHPKNPDVMNFVFSAYQGKITLLSDIARQ
ncbi:MAG: zf-HC2 domain-containing protein [Acidobacteriota bacterium]|nr:zf-HC2 domain-containing protein [Acidobacteriota bacterium]